MCSSLASIGLLYSSLALIGRTGLTAPTWCAMVLFFVSMRRCLACMRLSARREVTRGSIIMSDDLLSSVQCEDPPGRYSQLESFYYSFDLLMCPIKKALSYKI